MTARLVVTLPPKLPSDEALLFAHDVRRRGAELLELRTDLGLPTLDVEALARVLPLLVAERGVPVPARWQTPATLVDRELSAAGDTGQASLLSFHSPEVLSPLAALRRWEEAGIGPGVLVKHVEPLGTPAQGARLLETQRLLRERFEARVTVLATGALALPFRCVLARNNALDYLAVSPSWSAAPGQRLLDDAFREKRLARRDQRLAILGSRIPYSRSPRIHPQPFDRLDLPEDAPVGELLDAIHPFYQGLAITSPFKKAAAQHVGSPLEAVNTLVRRPQGWFSANTDLDGALAVLEKLPGGEVTVLGDGGATTALRLAATRLQRPLRVLKRADLNEQPLCGPLVWTWPEHLMAPPRLRFQQAQVAVIAYGRNGRKIAAQILELGGQPRLLGAHWFVAQARRQRALWEEA